MENNNKRSMILGTNLTKRVYGLDIFRAIAILLVLLVHTKHLLPSYLIQMIDPIFMCDGVSVFFVLSGFLIGRILINTIESQKFTVKTLCNFWGNRWFRTLPLYYFILLILILLNYFNCYNFNYDLWKYLFFLQNFTVVIPEFYNVSWSLCVEEWFYIFIPVLLFGAISILKIDNKKSIILTIIIVVLLFNLIRLYRYYNLVYNIGLDPNWYLFNNWFFRTQVITRIDSIVYGVLGSYIYYYYFASWVSYKRIKFILGIIIIYFLPYLISYLLSTELKLMYRDTLSFTISAIGILLLLPLLSTLKEGKGFIYLLISIISLLSYSIYLTHTILQYFIEETLYDLNNVSKFILIWCITFFISYITYSYIETPMLKIRSKLTKKDKI